MSESTAELILNHATALAYLSWFWLPLVFAAYALGRRRLTIRQILAFTTAEAIAVGVAIWLRNEIYL